MFPVDSESEVTDAPPVIVCPAILSAVNVAADDGNVIVLPLYWTVVVFGMLNVAGSDRTTAPVVGLALI